MNKISLVALLLFFTPLLSSATYTPFVYSKNYYYGPFTKDDDAVNMTFQYAYTTGSGYTNIFERMTVYENQAIAANIVSISTTEEHIVLRGKAYKFSHKFYPAKAFNYYNTCYIKFEIVNGLNNGVLDTRTFTLQSNKESIINDDLYGSSYNMTMYKYINPGYADGKFSEVFDLTNFKDSFECGTYHTLPLQEMKFKYEFVTNYYSSTALLYFEDPLDLFPYLRITEYKYRFIELEHYELDGHILWRPKNLFVHPDTLVIAETRLSGYVATKQFFFPVGTIGAYSELTFYLKVNDIGPCAITIDCPFKFYPTNTLVGDCTISDYCVLGGINNG